MTANNEYKFKQWNADNKSCRRTSIGPTFGGPINRLLQINHIHTDGQSRPTEFVAYGTADKVVGLVSLLDHEQKSKPLVEESDILSPRRFDHDINGTGDLMCHLGHRLGGCKRGLRTGSPQIKSTN